jgi:hypothetical protein
MTEHPRDCVLIYHADIIIDDDVVVNMFDKRILEFRFKHLALAVEFKLTFSEYLMK